MLRMQQTVVLGTMSSRTMGAVRIALILFTSLALGACENAWCTSSSECPVRRSCSQLRFECTASRASIRVLMPGEPIVGGIDALASPGDWVLENGEVTAV